MLKQNEPLRLLSDGKAKVDVAGSTSHPQIELRDISVKYKPEGSLRTAEQACVVVSGPFRELFWLQDNMSFGHDETNEGEDCHLLGTENHPENTMWKCMFDCDPIDDSKKL